MVTSRNALTLQKKYEVLDMARKNLYASLLSISLVVNHRLLPSLETNLRVNFGALWIKLTEWNHALQERSCTSEFDDVNDALNRWYLHAVLQNIYFVGPLLCEKVKKIVKPNEWTDGRRDKMWKEWESAENQETWEGRLSIRGRRGYLSWYSNEKIWNLDETACSWRALPDHGFSKRGSQCKGGKKAKQP